MTSDWTDRYVPLPEGKTPTEYVLEDIKLPFELRPDQVETFNTLAQWNGSGCYADVGTGKTVLATLLGLYFGLRGEIDQILVVMPPILLLQWDAWFKNFPFLTRTLYKGSPAQRKKMSLKNDVIMMSLDIFKNDHKRIMDELKNARMFVIVDEAAKIRRIQTQNFKAVRDFLLWGVKFFTLLTGTPINNPVHCYAYIRLLVPTAYRNYSQFLLAHVTSTDLWGEPKGFKNLDLLADNLAQYSVRVCADEVLTMPEVTYDPLLYELESKHKKLYDALVEEELLELDSGKVLDATSAQKLYVASQKILLVPAEFGGEAIHPTGFKVLENMIDEAGILDNVNDKLIVYCHHKEVNEAVTAYANSIKGACAIQAYGGLGADKNLKNVDRFLNDPAVNILVANPGSIGIGLNLQSVCRTMLFMEMPRTSNDFTQAVGRVKREGQNRRILVRMAVAAGTIQEVLAKNVVRKEDIVQKIVPTKDTIRKALYGK